MTQCSEKESGVCIQTSKQTTIRGVTMKKVLIATSLLLALPIFAADKVLTPGMSLEALNLVGETINVMCKEASTVKPHDINNDFSCIEKDEEFFPFNKVTQKELSSEGFETLNSCKRVIENQKNNLICSMKDFTYYIVNAETGEDFLKGRGLNDIEQEGFDSLSSCVDSVKFQKNNFVVFRYTKSNNNHYLGALDLKYNNRFGWNKDDNYVSDVRYFIEGVKGSSKKYICLGYGSYVALLGRTKTKFKELMRFRKDDHLFSSFGAQENMMRSCKKTLQDRIN